MDFYIESSKSIQNIYIHQDSTPVEMQYFKKKWTREMKLLPKYQLKVLYTGIGLS